MSSIRKSLLVSAVLVSSYLAGCTVVPPREAPAPVETLPATPTPAPTPEPSQTLPRTFKPVSFAALPGWKDDDLRQAWPAFLSSCRVLARKVAWKEPCGIAADVTPTDEKAIRLFFETFFVPHQVSNADGSDTGMVTGYYEPLLNGARKRGGKFQTPLHRAPRDMLTVDLATLYPELKGQRVRGRMVGSKVVPYHSRAEMARLNTLAGTEILWVDDAIDAFFLQIQGSGRVFLADTRETVRLAYADQNGHPYKSIGRYLVDQKELTLDQASAQRIKAWFAANPSRQQELLNANPSYVFFKEEPLPDPKVGPKGALGVPLTTERSIAVDPQHIPLGAPVYLATTLPSSQAPLQRLTLAQDTGSAIKNAVRADYFWGFGAKAGEQAGKMKQRGRLWVLLPKGVGQPKL